MLPDGPHLFLPLDDRPCNLLFVLMLCAMASVSPCLWERYDGVEAKHRGGPPAIRTSAEMTPPGGSGPVVVSLNALAAGGLVGSRTIRPERLPVPNLPHDGLYHFVVPRLEPTARDQATQEAYAETRRYLAKDAAQLSVKKVLQGRADVTSLPAGGIRDWVMRTEGWIRWVEALRLPPDRLLVTFDDTRHGVLASYLRERYGFLSEHVVDGADEGGMLLMARAIRETTAERVRAGVIYQTPAAANRHGRYESLTVATLLERQARWLGLELVDASELREGEPILFVHNWTTVQGDRHTAQSPKPNPFAENPADLLRPYIRRPVYVADIAFANGGDPTLAATLLELQDAGECDLRAYASWNTAANTLGTVLATLVVDQLMVDTGVERRFREQFLTARFLDDVLYQSEYRQSLENQLRRVKGNPWELTPLQTAGLAADMTKELRQRAFARGMIATPTGWSWTLPWERSFEVSVTTAEMRQLVTGTPRCY